jgi:hypothetical protein
LFLFSVLEPLDWSGLQPFRDWFNRELYALPFSKNLWAPTD